MPLPPLFPVSPPPPLPPLFPFPRPFSPPHYSHPHAPIIPRPTPPLFPFPGRFPNPHYSPSHAPIIPLPTPLPTPHYSPSHAPVISRPMPTLFHVPPLFPFPNPHRMGSGGDKTLQTIRRQLQLRPETSSTPLPPPPPPLPTSTPTPTPNQPPRHQDPFIELIPLGCVSNQLLDSSLVSRTRTGGTKSANHSQHGCRARGTS